MRNMRAPFRFEVAGLLARFRSLPVETETAVTIGLPGLKINVKVDDVQRLTSGSTTIFEQDFNALDGTLGVGASEMVNLEVTQSTTSTGREAWQTVDQGDLELGVPVYIFDENQIVKPMEGVGVNRLGHPTQDLSNSSFLPFAISEGYLSTSGAQGNEAVALGAPAAFEQVLATQVLDLSAMSEVILEYDREGYGSDFKARVVLREIGGDNIQDEIGRASCRERV